ncbi:BgTH12-02822 [Blumeria graminis f. sp. triticale]|nr:BgTH12-02822 [Blumeria graminis f. sp. triticale]
MKFLRAATVAAMAGLLLLVPAAYGKMYYQCVSEKTFTVSAIEKYKKKASIDQVRSDDPEVITGQQCKAARFTERLQNKVKMSYLFQVVGMEPSYRLFEYNESTWQPCILRNG